jgi:hypothetical protein
MEQNNGIISIERKAMKTRILIAALMIAFSTSAIAGTNQVKSEDSLYTSSLANLNGIFQSETEGMNVVSNSPSEYVPSSGSFENAVNLEEWVKSRESWEQKSSELAAGFNLTESVDLEGWFTSRELWEQESSEFKAVGAEYSSSLLEEWVAGRETWEQENSGIELTNEFTGKIQQEWISNREAWEQK